MSVEKPRFQSLPPAIYLVASKKNQYYIFMKNRLFPSLMNSRDIGGYITPFGQTQRGVIYRSGSLSNIHETDLNEMSGKHITDIFDLRSKRAKEREIDPTLNDPRFHYHSFFIEAGERLPLDRDDNIANYIKMYSSKDEITPILKEIASCKKAVLIHCSAGKDRTGVVISLLQFIAGVPLKEINQEYLLSFFDIDDHVRKLKISYPDLSPVYDERDDSFLPAVFEILKSRFQTEESYYRFMGL